MRSLIKFLVVGIATFGIHAAGTWTVSTFKNNGGTYGFGNGGANVTSFSNPYGLVNSPGGLFVADTNNNVIKFLIPPTPETAIAGDSTANNTDNVGIAAQFNGPSGLVIRPTIFDLFVADSINQSVRRVITPFSLDEMTMMPTMDPDWNVTSPLVGLAYVPQNVVFDAAGANLYVSGDDGNVHKYDTTNFAGGATATFAAGALPTGMTFDTAGDLYITADNGVYKLDAATLGGAGAPATLIAGSVGATGTTDGAGLTARFDAPFGITFDPISGSLFVADTGNNIIRQLAPDGSGGWTVSTIAGTGVPGDADGAAATFLAPTGIIFGGQGMIFVTDAGDGGGIHDGLVRMLTFVPTGLGISPTNTDIQLAMGGSLAHVTAAAGENVGRATETTFEVNASSAEGVGGAGGGEGESETFDGTTNNQDVTEFRFGLSPQRLKMDIRAINNGALANYDKNYGDYGSMLKALETALGATKAMANVGNGMSFWASGVYAQGRNKIMFGNPAGADKHYGIMMGTHYYHKPSRQLIGMAFDVGLGGSRANIDRKLKSAYRSAEATLYYGYGITKRWKINLQAAYMLVRANNHRPYGTGNIAIATSRAKSTITSGSVETDYKFKPMRSVHLKPTVGLRFGHTKQDAYSEKDAGTNSMHFRAASMMEVALKTGFKVSLFYKKDDVMIYSLYPEINFTHYLKAGKMRQKAGLVNSGTVQLLESGTPGKNLLSLGLGAGMTNTEDGTKYQVGYTANFQRYRKSQEVMLKGSWQF